MKFVLLVLIRVLLKLVVFSSGNMDDLSDGTVLVVESVQFNGEIVGLKASVHG